MGAEEQFPGADEGLLRALESVVVGAVGLTTRTLEATTPELELTFTQWRVLLVVGEHPAGIRIGALAIRVGTSVPSMSRLVRRLDLRGLVTAERGQDDRRATLVRLTPTGSAVRQRILDDRRERLTDLLATVPSQTRAESEPVFAALALAMSDYR